MSNLNLQHALEIYWGKPLKEILAENLAKHKSVSAVADALGVSPTTVRNWLWYEAQFHPEWLEHSAFDQVPRRVTMWKLTYLACPNCNCPTTYQAEQWICPRCGNRTPDDTIQFEEVPARPMAAR